MAFSRESSWGSLNQAIITGGDHDIQKILRGGGIEYEDVVDDHQCGGADVVDVDMDGVPDSEDDNIDGTDPLGFDIVDARKNIRDDVMFSSLNTIALRVREIITPIVQEILQALFTVRDDVAQPTNIMLDMISALGEPVNDRSSLPTEFQEISRSCFRVYTGIIESSQTTLFQELESAIRNAPAENRAALEEEYGDSEQRRNIINFAVSYGFTQLLTEMCTTINLRTSLPISSISLNPVLSNALRTYPARNIAFDNNNDPRVIKGWPRIQRILKKSSASTVYFWAVTQFLIFANIELLAPTVTNRPKFYGSVRYYAIQAPDFEAENIIGSANAEEPYRKYCIEHFMAAISRCSYVEEFETLIRSYLTRDVRATSSSASTSNL